MEEEPEKNKWQWRRKNAERCSDGLIVKGEKGGGREGRVKEEEEMEEEK